MKTYPLGGKQFGVPDLTWMQEYWVHQTIVPFMDTDQSKSAVEVFMSAPEIQLRLVAIIAVEEGQDTKDAKKSFKQVEEFEEWIKLHSTMREVGDIAGDFFSSGNVTKILQSAAMMFKGLTSST